MCSAAWALPVLASPARPAAWPLLRVQTFGKSKLKWKKIAEHFGHKIKSCHRRYSKLTGKEAPEGAD